ncbi:ABC transporter ATP-binding protein [Pseudoxanthomonas gei]|uniref:ABC transporter ATP-binding protein n=1 Tax=Pseudoxanthomonas gei TaxID=1383030 RepID=A0ABX0ABU1_9GAMM|nr:ABC transporter ATP-binding protein [Pseudoxanthomonas gei]NDK39049.1 ABC transporter ATP-binding protein [Pseudoxanthomonas gei]
MGVELVLESVGFTYPGGQRAVDGVGMRLGAGVLGLLGPNGAGKSSLMRVLATLARASSGRVTWRGEDIARKPDALRAELGYLPQDFGVYDALSAREFLAFLAAVKGTPSRQVGERVAQCLEMVGLTDMADRRLGGFSGGMRQRVGIAQALLNDPRLLIVDEPTVGLDPEERVRFRHLLAELAADRLVILSTHIVSDIEASAGELAVMAGGQLRFHGTPEALIADAVGHVWSWTVPSERLAEVRAAHRISRAQRRSDGVEIRVVGEQLPSNDARAVAPDLEDAYLWRLHRTGLAA